MRGHVDGAHRDTLIEVTVPRRVDVGGGGATGRIDRGNGTETRWWGTR